MSRYESLTLDVDQPGTRTIRLVADVPDFAGLYAHSPLTPRMAAQLWSIAEILYDDVHLGFADEMVAQLPPIARLHADERFVTAFASRFALIAKRIAEGLDDLESIATCTADEMALHLIITYAEDVFSWHDPEWINQLPEGGDDYGWLPEILLKDEDVLLLYVPALDGIEDPESPINQHQRYVNLHPNDWFKQFP